MVSVGRLYNHYCTITETHHVEFRDAVLSLRHIMLSVGILYYHGDTP